MTEAPSEASFRDPSGFIYFRDGVPYRLIRRRFAKHFDRLHASGLYDELASDGLLIPHVIESRAGDEAREPYAVIRPEQVPFISYPFEWCFDQLKDAAILTLEIQRRALQKGMILRDATAYNVQFLKGRPIHIDTLSLGIYEEGQPWMAYNEFCRHFLAPLALMAYVDHRLGRQARTFLDGVPLDLASSLLPRRTWFNPALAVHIHLHAKLTGGTGRRAKKSAVRKEGLALMVSGLMRTISKLKPRGSSHWERYYADCTYSQSDLNEKERVVEDLLSRVSRDIETLCDLGANTGRFSRLASAKGIRTLALDYDSWAVNRCYLESKSRNDAYILPLVSDLRNPSPALGWRNRERSSLLERAKSDVVLALALVHHLCIGANVPFTLFIRLLRDLAPVAIVEFVPADDPQAARLMSFREDVFDWYTKSEFESAIESEQMRVLEKADVGASGRTLYLLQRTGSE